MKLILLIDDDEGIRFSYGEALRGHGYRVIESDSGEAGLEMARQHVPDLILTDINMPGGDGQTLLHQIRADPELCEKQVILMTGRPDLVPARKGMEQGADDFLVKPIKSEALFACVEARLNRGELHWRVEDRVFSDLRKSMTSHLPHEFITPLAGILGLSDILKREFSVLSAQEMQEFHNDIHQSALRLQRTVTNYLLIVELNSGSVDLDVELREPLSPSKVLKSVATGVELAVERHGRREDITTHIEECSLLVIASDLTRIVEELVDNALKFSRVGSQVAIHIRSDGVLVVTDSGRGMLTEEIEQIGSFRQFNRKRQEQQGLGVGLTLVQKLASRNGATVLLSRRPDQGMELRISFRLGS
jgi:two-component system sensor histidine kinase/response regulator